MGLTIFFLYSEPVLTYLVDEYKKDTDTVNVTACVHVEAVFPGDPVGETMYVYTQGNERTNTCLHWKLSIMATFEDQHWGHYREVAFIEELFYTQTVYLGPGCLAIIEKLAFHQRGHYREVTFIEGLFCVKTVHLGPGSLLEVT